MSRFDRIAGALVMALAVWGCSSSSAPEEKLPPVPTVNGIDKTVLSPGDTVTVTGSDFHATTSFNRVRFNNPLADATPFEGTTTTLRAVVPYQAASGAVSVIVPNQPTPGVGPVVEVPRAIGEVWTFGGSGSVEVSTPDGARYLVVPRATGGATTQDHAYKLTAAALPPVATTSQPNESGAPRGATWTVRERFEAMRWQKTREVVERAGAPTLPKRRIERAPAETAQPFRQFNVWNTIDENASVLNTNNYTRVTAELKHTGQYCLVYADVDTLLADNLSVADFKNFGDMFDQSIRPSNTMYFGTESDVDQNGKVILLISPVINRITPDDANFFVGGFFFAIDLYETGGGIPSGTTNHSEILYLLAADPDSVWSDAAAAPASAVAEENIMTIVHEYQHLISFSFRIFTFGPNAAQVTWFEEGMAHAAEDLLSKTTADPKYNSSNEGRGMRYRVEPGRASLEDDRSPVEQRGGIYLLLRLLGDRYGDQIFKQILQSNCLGRVCIENVTGVPFNDTMAEFLAALYLSGRGINTDDPYNYDTIDINDFGPLLVRTRTFNGADNNDLVRRSTGDFYIFQSPTTATSRLSMFTASPGMGMRTTIVRIQ